jgi:hypothetical protein
MKKSLLIVAAAMAVGFGMSASAATSASYGSWSFEDIGQGTRIPATLGGLGGGNNGSWSAKTNDGSFAVITNVPSNSGISYIAGAGTYTNALYFDGAVSNQFDSAALLDSRVKTKFLLKPGQLEGLSMLSNVAANAKLAFYFDATSNFNLLHGTAGIWTTTKFTTVSFPAGNWVQVIIDQDNNVLNDNGKFMFSVTLNGMPMTNAVGYTRVGSAFTYGTGTWFEVKDATSSMNALVGMGVGILDDVVNEKYAAASEVAMDIYFNVPGDYDTWAEAKVDDWDNDGYNNLLEAIAGTNPKDVNDYLKIKDITVAGGQVLVTIDGTSAGAATGPEALYVLQSAPEVGGTYTNLDSIGKTTGELTIDVAPEGVKKFYKVVVPYTGD